jgi:hypothetical protein
MLANKLDTVWKISALDSTFLLNTNNDMTSPAKPNKARFADLLP